MSILPNGYGSPFVKVFYFKAASKTRKETFRPIDTRYVVTSLEYKYAEEEDDTAVIDIETDDSTIADRAEFQKGAQLKLLWGYIEGPQSKAISVYIRDVDAQYGDRVSLKLTCTDKASYMKDFTSQEIHNAGTQNDEDQWTVFKLFGDYCKKYNLQGRLRGNGFDFKVNLDPNDTGRSVDQNTGVPKYKDSGYPFDVPKVISLPGWENEEALKFDVNRYMYYPQANKSDFQLLWELLQREKHGPWVVTGHGNELTVAQRPLKKKAAKLYTYRGGSGELLTCHVSDQGQIMESEAEAAGTASWDGENKQFNYVLKDPSNNFEDKLNVYTEKMSGIVSGIGDSQAVRFAEDYLTIQSIKNAGALLFKNGLGGFSFKSASGLTGAARFAEGVVGAAYLEMANQWSQYDASQMVQTANPDDDATNPNVKKFPDGSTERRITLPNGAVIIKKKTIRGSRTDQFMNSLSADGKQNYDVTYVADIEASKANAKKITDYANLLNLTPNLASVFNQMNVRVSSQSDPAIASAEAENRKAENALNKIKITASAIGDPRISDMQILTINGIGNKYSGNYYTKKVTHKIKPDSGYLMDYDELVSNSVGQSEDGDNLIKNTKLPGEINIIIADEVPEDTYRVTATDGGTYARPE